MTKSKIDIFINQGDVTLTSTSNKTFAMSTGSDQN